MNKTEPSHPDSATEECRGRSFGQRVRCFTAANFRLVESIYPAGARLPRHAHELPYLCLVLRGGFTESVAHNEWTCERFGLISNLTGDSHVDHFAVASCTFNIEFAGELLDQLATRNRPRYHRGDGLVWLTLKLHEELCYAADELPLGVEALVAEIAGEASESPCGDGREPAWLVHVRELIQDQYDQRLGLEALTRVAGVHPVHLSRAFHHWYGATIGEYVRALRVDRASRALAESNLPLATLSLECGFHDQSHFTRTFRRCTSMTPAQFRSRYGRR